MKASTMFKASRTVSVIAMAVGLFGLAACTQKETAPKAAIPPNISTEASTATADIVNAATLTPKPLEAEARPSLSHDSLATSWWLAGLRPGISLAARSVAKAI